MLLRVFCCSVIVVASSARAAQVRVDGGVLRLNTDDTEVLCAEMMIGTNGCLAGTGRVRSDATIAGEVAPEVLSLSEGATLRFSSNLVFLSGSHFVCDIFSNTNRDQLNVSGSVSGTGQVVAVKHADCAPLAQQIVIGSTASTYDDISIHQTQPQSWNLTVSGKELLLTDLRGDSNGDGLPDWWEVEYFGGRTNAIAQADDDGDTSVNLGEYVAGTDPLSGASCLVVVPGTSAGCAHILSWPGAVDRTYTVYACTNLTAGSFAVCAQNIPATVPLTVYTDTTFSAESTYYKIQATLE